MAAASPKKVSGASGVQSMKSSGGLWFLVVMAAVALLVAIGFAVSGDSDTSPIGKSAMITKSLTVELRPDRWTEWINLPVGVNFRVDTKGWHRYEFWGGEQRVVEKQKPGERPRWFGNVPGSIFRLKGEAGTATVSWDEPRR